MTKLGMRERAGLDRYGEEALDFVYSNNEFNLEELQEELGANNLETSWVARALEQLDVVEQKGDEYQPRMSNPDYVKNGVAREDADIYLEP